MSEIYPVRSKLVAARLLGDEMIIMAPADSSLFTLNEIASKIWQAADGRTTLSSIIRNIVCPEFDVDPETAYRDAKGFLQDLVQHGILTLSDSPISAPAALQVSS